MKLRIQELAKQQGYTMKQLTELTQLTPTTVSRYWHSYIQRANPEILKKFARVLQVDDWRSLISDE